MKRQTLYIAALVVMFVLIALAQMQLPRRFSWTVTFDPADKEPMGGWVFDSLMRASLPAGYDVTGASIVQLHDSAALQGHNLLFVTERMWCDSLEICALLDIVRRGGHVCFAVSDLEMDLLDSIGISNNDTGYAGHLRQLLSYQWDRDTIEWQSRGRQPARRFAVERPIIRSNYLWQQSDSIEKTHWTVHAYRHDNDEKSCIVASREFGRGRIVVAGVPLLFTNYGVLDRDNADFVMRTLSLMDASRPLLRKVTVSMNLQEPSQSPLRVMVGHAPLRWSLYLSLALVVLFMVFTARRRQRAIPVVRPAPNRQLEFARLIGTLYYQRHNHHDLLSKKYTYFAGRLRHDLFIDIDDAADDDNAARIAEQTGLERRQVRSLLRSLRTTVGRPDATVTDDALAMYIDRMDEIVRKL